MRRHAVLIIHQRSLNESPYEKVGKFAVVRASVSSISAGLNESPYEKVGKSLGIWCVDVDTISLNESPYEKVGKS